MTAPVPEYFLRTPRLGFRVWEKEDFLLAMAVWGDPSQIAVIAVIAVIARDRLRRLVRMPLRHDEEAYVATASSDSLK